ncbi:CBS domain-containing protein [Rheinheimera sediminis]|uniref:CBS domain-containing protein n=1 Tax=Rheinheimera sp. YQF-1 TaxID=2499626 RepID=UPI000FDB3609|nr:CBS domain-containing protein [Rheinheimera sp. YQF-1]RVT47395.1 CBS domain-containing protein [Rheinheimera sp. YQF-1]
MDLLKIADHMNRHPVTFTEEMSVEEAVNKLILAGQLGGPVINKEKKVIGFVSEQDCLSRMLSGTYHLQQAASVKDVMRTEVLTVKSYHGIVDLAQTMLMAKPKVYPVVDDDGYLQGVISRTDVLRAIDLELHSHYKAVS